MKFTFVDLFSGIGGTRMAFTKAGGHCLYSSEWNPHSRLTYSANFPLNEGEIFDGDIRSVKEDAIPDHDVLVAGFPCQPFSSAGVSKKNSLGRPHGFSDQAQGTLFFDVARILSAKSPPIFLLENVRNLISHDSGRTFKVIIGLLTEELGYSVSYQVINSQNWVPQSRKRIYIIGTKGFPTFNFDSIRIPQEQTTLAKILHPEDGTEESQERYTEALTGKVLEKYTLRDGTWSYLQKHAKLHKERGNGFGYTVVRPTDVARTLSARYHKDGSEILIHQGQTRNPRRLTPRECARLMGFPESFVIPVSDSQAYKQFGNSIVVPVVAEIATQLASIFKSK